MRNLLYIFLFSLIAAAAVSCISDDFNNSPGLRLKFSTDTVNFDTVFTDLGTPTARLKVFNPDKKSVNISSIRFKNPDSPFSMNVDGVSGYDFSNVEIRGGDSIFIFIECYLPENSDPRPFRVGDDLLFLLNGNEQKVRVEAWGQNVIRLRNAVVDQDMTLSADRPYIIFDSLTVSPGATLSIQPGANILFHDKAKLVVEGKLLAIGEPGKMIQMRGDRLDNVLPDVGYDILSGQWKGIRFAPSSFDNRMEYVDMRSTTEGVRIDSTANLDLQKLTLVNSWLHNSESTVIDSRHARVDAFGCVFSEAADAVVSLTGGMHLFSQCTFANYYLFSVVSQPILLLQHLMPSESGIIPNPLMQASFNNCIIYGLSSDISPGDLTGSDVFLRYTLLKANGNDDDNFINCIWNEDPLFLTVRPDYYFNYHLAEDSPVLHSGDPALVDPLTEIDMDGNPRIPEPGIRPALGAYSK